MLWLHWAPYQEYLNIRILNNLIVLTELFPTLDLLDWRKHIYIYIHTHTRMCVCVCTTMKKHKVFRRWFYLLNYFPTLNVMFLFFFQFIVIKWNKKDEFSIFYFHWWHSLSSKCEVICVQKFILKKSIIHQSIYLSVNIKYHLFHIYLL